jgi:hypothetical protein
MHVFVLDARFGDVFRDDVDQLADTFTFLRAAKLQQRLLCAGAIGNIGAAGDELLGISACPACQQQQQRTIAIVRVTDQIHWPHNAGSSISRRPEVDRQTC